MDLLKAIKEYRDILGLNSTGFNQMSDEDKKLIPNWPWYELKQQIRKTPCPIELIVVNEKFHVGELFVVGRMGTDDVFRITVNHKDLMADTSLVQKDVWNEITKLIDARLEGLDWSEYFGTTSAPNRGSEQPQ